MLPLLIPGIVSLASNAVDAWKAHTETKAATQTAPATNFEDALNKATSTAAEQLAAMAAKQQAEQVSGQVDALTRQILQAPGVQAHAQGGAADFKIDKNGNLFVVQSGGGLKRLPVSAEVQASVDQLNALRRAQPASAGSVPVQILSNAGAQMQASFAAI